MAPARAVRDLFGDGRLPSTVRRLLVTDNVAGRLALEVIGRGIEREGALLVDVAGSLPSSAAGSPRTVVARLARATFADSRTPARLIGVASRPDLDLVAVIGDVALAPRICRAPDVAVVRVAERASFAAADPPRQEGPCAPDPGAARILRLVERGRRSQARQVLVSRLAEAHRRARSPLHTMAMRLALARLDFDEARPVDALRVIIPGLLDCDDAALPVGALADRQAGAVLACHAAVDALRFDEARQYAGAANVVAALVGAGMFEATLAQWRVCWWRGDLDGARGQVERLSDLARTPLQQARFHRCALRVLRQAWPGEVAVHQQWLHERARSCDGSTSALSHQALAEDAVWCRDATAARVHLAAARRLFGRATTARVRGMLHVIEVAASAIDSRRPPASSPGLSTPLTALRAGAWRCRTPQQRQRLEGRMTTAGIAPAVIAPWHTPTGDHAMIEDLLEVIEACNTDAGTPAVSRLCSLVREHLGAAGVGLYASPDSKPLAGVGGHPCVSATVTRDALTRNTLVEPAANSIGVESAVPIRFGGSPIAALCCRWAYDAPVDRRRAALLMNAAAAVCAPVVQSLLESRTRQGEPGEDLGLLGTSEAMRQLRAAVRRAAAAPFPVLIEGESGSGKELVARAVHAVSVRRARRFCAVNCAAVSDELLEAELFGHVRGAFTGAVGERPGLFEDADGGTLLLDEVAELSPRGQAKLLRVLQEGEIRRVGENIPRRLDVRIVAATNRPLSSAVACGQFRDDLRFRLDVVRLAVPPLRTRGDDVSVLAQAFWRDALSKTRGRAVLDADALAALARYDWPGNVRELQNVIATLAVKAPARGRVTAADVVAVRGGAAATTAAPLGSLDAARREFDAAFLRRALAECRGQRGEAARQLGLTRQGLLKLMHRLGIDRHTGRPPAASVSGS